MPKLFRGVRVAAVSGVLLMLGVLAAIWASGIRIEASASVGGRQVVACSAHLLSGVGLSSDGRSATAQVGGQSVRVSAEEVEVVGVRTVRLPAATKKVELVETRGGVRILLDGASVD